MLIRALLLIALSALCAFPAAAEARPWISPETVTVCDGGLDGGELPDFDDSACARASLYDVDPQGRLVWVRMTVSVPPDASAAPLGIFTGALASREIWWNGTRLGAEGVPGARREAEKPGNIDSELYLPPALIKPGDNLLVLKMSSFHNRVRLRAPMHYAALAPYGEGKAAALRFYGPGLLAAGALLAAAIYFAAAFAANRRDLSLLFIALMSAFAVAQFAAEAARGAVDYPYPLHLARLIAIAAFASGFQLSATAYVAHRFAPARWPLYVAAAAAATLAHIPFARGFDPTAIAALLTPTPFALAAALYGARARIKGAWVAALALAGYAALILLEGSRFLDRTFFFAAGALAVVFFIDQLTALSRARNEAAEASKRAARAELELLQRRIAPHFLMNTLNALSEWVEQDPKTGVKMIDALAGEFRFLSQTSGRAFIPLADEIALCRRHLDVMSYRVDRAFSLKADGVDGARPVPPGVLHTLVENAFTHGRFADGAEFVLAEERTDRETLLTLTAPPPDRAAARREPGREGLAYVKGRLDAAFGERASVTSGPSPDGGWRTVISLPNAKARR
ncbi:MAG: sensor histidine kinase [Amphiplicatus sp.]